MGIQVKPLENARWKVATDHLGNRAVYDLSLKVMVVMEAYHAVRDRVSAWFAAKAIDGPETEKEVHFKEGDPYLKWRHRLFPLNNKTHIRVAGTQFSSNSSVYVIRMKWSDIDF